MKQHHSGLNALAAAVCVAAMLSVPLCACGLSSAAGAGTLDDPCVGYTGTASGDETVRVYRGTYVDITFEKTGYYDEYQVVCASDHDGLHICGLGVSGNVNCATAKFTLIGTVEEYTDELYSVTVYSRSLGDLAAGCVTVPYSDNAVPPTLPGAVGFSVCGGTLPPGLEVDGYGNITGTPTEGGTYYFTLSFAYNNVQLREDHRIIIEELPSTTTTAGVENIYMVEGGTVSFVANGTATDDGEYSAVITCDGGTVTPSTMGSTCMVTYTAPQVDGTTTFTITITSDLEGWTVSSDTVSVHVVDKLTVSAPAVGTVASS